MPEINVTRFHVLPRSVVDEVGKTKNKSDKPLLPLTQRPTGEIGSPKSHSAKAIMVKVAKPSDINAADNPLAAKKEKIEAQIQSLQDSGNRTLGAEFKHILSGITRAHDLVNDDTYLTNEEQIGLLKSKVAELERKISDLKQTADINFQVPDEQSKETQGIKNELIAWATDTIAKLNANIQYLNTNQSSSVYTKENLFKSKAIISEAAIQVLDAQIKIQEQKASTVLESCKGGENASKLPQNVADELKTIFSGIEKLKEAKEKFKKRIDYLNNGGGVNSANLKSIVLNPKTILGAEKSIGKWDKFKDFLHDKSSYFSNTKTSAALAQYRKNLLEGTSFNCATPEITEQTIVTKALESIFKSAGIKNGKKIVKHELHAKEVSVINSREAMTITKSLSLKFGDKFVSCTSTISHAANLSEGFKKKYNGQVVCSHSIHEHQKAAALAQTQIKIPNAEGIEEVAFSGLRHGALCAFGWTKEGVAGMTDKELGGELRSLAGQMKQSSKQGGIGFKLSEKYAKCSDEVIGKKLRSDIFAMSMLRKQANINRARDLLEAAITTNPKLMAQINKIKQSPSSSESKSGQIQLPTKINLGELNINSISLLTPDGLRSGVNDNEKMMSKEQTEALKFLEQNPGQIFLIDGVEVSVSPKVSAFSFAVNAGGVGTGSHLNLVSGHADTRAQNDEGFTNLMGKDFSKIPRDSQKDNFNFLGQVGYFIKAQNTEITRLRNLLDSTDFQKKPSEDERNKVINDLVKIAQDISAVKKLSLQCAEIYTSKGFLDAGTEPYKLVSRLALLSYMVSGQPFFNCKSGKDRTGMLDVQAKFLAVQYKTTGEIPDYDRERSTSEKTQLRAMMAEGGNHEVQQAYTGYPGFKLYLNLLQKNKKADALHAELGGGPALTRSQKLAVENRATADIRKKNPLATQAHIRTAVAAALRNELLAVKNRTAILVGASAFTAS
ncbi:Inositol phosphate phosphatase IpgD [Polaromonas vacuolata]|uniref:Inositol phosphate phosphatase IpgD n=1 Tax=Polaromonas vacuolata TaxID=37448 RepID=A0A6H2H9U3_9BURK|nr:inositol phosphate phosphatase SopB [Polaromonas vacuolata]QJC56364.1 Inositol phosphate phosphatase IpgD [Polaromonas vacuolata]